LPRRLDTTEDRLNSVAPLLCKKNIFSSIYFFVLIKKTVCNIHVLFIVFPYLVKSRAPLPTVLAFTCKQNLEQNTSRFKNMSKEAFPPTCTINNI